jgi:hypothetical protein
MLLGSKPGEDLRLHMDDAAVLDQEEQPRDNLPCVVTPGKAVLDFDFTFHSGYDVTIPARELEPGSRLTVLLRVTPLTAKSDPTYFFQRVDVPRLQAPAKGDGVFHGFFVMGEGRYRIKWMMRDELSRVCSRSWEVQAKVGPKDGQIKPHIQPGEVRPLTDALFGQDPPVERTAKDGLLKVNIIANFVPRNPNATVLNDDDLEAVVAILRRISQDPRIGEYSLTACSLTAQNVFYRQESSGYIDYPALGAAMKSMNLGLISAKQLAAQKGPGQFILDLFEEQARKADFDALILVGPKTGWEEKLPKEIADSAPLDGRLVFYLNYDRDPFQNPWPDLIANAVKRKRGMQYTITHPQDLFNAWSDLMSRVSKTKKTALAPNLP